MQGSLMSHEVSRGDSTYPLSARLPESKVSCESAQVRERMKRRHLGSEAHVLAHRLAHANGALALVRFLPGRSHPGLAAVQGILSLRADLHGRNVLRLSYSRGQHSSCWCTWDNKFIWFLAYWEPVSFCLHQATATAIEHAADIGSVDLMQVDLLTTGCMSCMLEHAASQADRATAQCQSPVCATAPVRIMCSTTPGAQ